MNKKLLPALSFLLLGSLALQSQHGCFVIPAQGQTGTPAETVEKRIESLELADRQDADKKAEPEKKERPWSEAERGHCVVQ